jgi:hypothetical protein
VVEPTWDGLSTTVSVGFSVGGVSGLGVGMADGEGETIGSTTLLVDSTLELDGGGGVNEDTMLSSNDDENDEAAADELSETNVEETPNVEDIVLVMSASLVTTSLSDVEAFTESELLWKSDSTNDEKSIWRDESCSEELLGNELEDEDDGVGAAGVVPFVTICRFTCLGK